MSIKAFIGLIVTIVGAMLGLFFMFYNNVRNDIEERNKIVTESINDLKADIKSTGTTVDMIKESQIKTSAYMEIILQRVADKKSPEDTKGSN